MTRYARFVEGFENRFGDGSWRKTRKIGLGSVVFIAVCVTTVVRGDMDKPGGLTAQRGLLIAAIGAGLVCTTTFLSWSDSTGEHDHGFQEFFAKVWKALGWIALTLAALAASTAFCYVSSKGAGARQTIVVLGGRTNVHGGFFKSPFAWETKLKDFTVTTEAIGANYGKPVSATIEATFRIRTDDEAALARFVANHHDPETALRKAAEARLREVFVAASGAKTTSFGPRAFWHTIESETIEIEPALNDRRYTGLVWLANGDLVSRPDDAAEILWLAGDVRVLRLEGEGKEGIFIIDRPFRD